MFACLPFDIMWLIWGEFVDANDKGLSTLDVAFCNHSMRADILRLLAKSKISTNFGGHVMKGEQLGMYLNWVAMRNVHCQSELFVKSADIPSMMRYLSHPMEQVTKMCFFSPFPQSYDVISSIASFIACFPALQEIDCDAFFGAACELTDYHLKGFINMKCPLKTLKIANCLDVSGAMMTLVLSAVANTLQDLTCNALDDTALICLSHELKHLQYLRMACDHIHTLSSLQQFCSCMSNSLKSLVLFRTSPNKGDRVSLDDTLVETIASAAVNLSYLQVSGFGLLDEPAVTVKSLRYVLDNNPNIATISLRDTTIFVEERLDNGNIVVEMRCGAYGGNDFIASFCSVDNLVVQKLEDHDFFRCNRKTLRLMGNRWGQSLKEVECEFDDSVRDADFEYFLECSPNITAMELNYSKGIGDSGLSMVPIFCSKLEVLKISYFYIITDEGMLRLLKGYQRFNTLQELTLSNCHNLGNDTIEHIAEYCPCLSVLRLRQYFLGETIFELILERKLRAEYIQCDDAEWVQQQLVEANFHPIPSLCS